MWKLAWKNIEKMKVIYGMIVALLILVFMICIFISSAIVLKTEKYTNLSKYLKQKGICIQADYLQIDHDGTSMLVRDAQELKDKFPEIRNVVAVESVWDIDVEKADKEAAMLCYSADAVEAFRPQMETGRWFTASDNKDEMLKVVVTYNEGQISVGDVITLATNGLAADSGETVTIDAEVIGVMKDDESFFYDDNISMPYGDYRDFYYTYDYEAEQGKLFVIASDAQILSGEKDGRFSELNFRLSPDYGFQKQMKGELVLTFDPATTEEEIRMVEDTLKQISGISAMYDLNKFNHNSKAYIYDELRRYLPILVCIFLFVLVAVISAHVISAKEHLRDYSIYYICGLTWRKCVRISLISSFLLVFVAWITIFTALACMWLLHMIDIQSFHFGYMHAVSMIGMAVIFVALSGEIPYWMMKGNSPVQVLKDNFG